MTMKKSITITEDENGTVLFETAGLKDYEVLGMLRFYAEVVMNEIMKTNKEVLLDEPKTKEDDRPLEPAA